MKAIRKRLRRWLGGAWLRKSQRLRFATVNGVRCKRVVLPDTSSAIRIERSLEAFGPSPRFPQLVARFENEVWVVFVPGERLVRADMPGALDEIIALYSDLYTRAPKAVAASETLSLQRAQQDLRFLRQVGVLDEAAWRELTAATERLVPERLWLGFDYVDPVVKNFVRPADGGPICAIDVESLAQEAPLGTGVAKAAVHWLTLEQRKRLLAAIEPKVPGLSAQLPFVELCFLARWTKMKLLTGKSDYLDAARFTPFRLQGSA